MPTEAKIVSAAGLAADEQRRLSALDRAIAVNSAPSGLLAGGQSLDDRVAAILGTASIFDTWLKGGAEK